MIRSTTCNLSWLFGKNQGPRTIRLIDSNPIYRQQLEAFASGATYSEGSLTFHKYRTEELDAYKDFLSDNSVRDEIWQACGVTAAEFKQHFLNEVMDFTDYMPYSLCIKDNGNLVGVMMSLSQVSDTPVHYLTPESEHIWKTKLNPINIFLDTLDPISYSYPDEKGRLPPNSVDIRTVLNLAWGAVAESHGGRNFLYKLILLSTALGYVHGLTLAVAVATSVRSSLLYKIGGISLAPLLYKDVEYLGERPFTNLKEDGARFGFISL